MCAGRSLSTRGMGPHRVIRPLLDVDVTNPAIHDGKRREICDNSRKFRRITQPILLEGCLLRRETPNKKVKLNEVTNIINPFSLSKLAYMSCSDKEKEDFNTKGTPDIEIKKCCYLLKDRSSNVMVNAIKFNHPECFKHGHKLGFNLPQWTCYSALAHESVEILKYAVENNCDFVVDLACREAAINGHLPCFEYIHKAGGLLTTDIMKAVVIHGSLDILKYLLKNGCEWTNDMCALSATSGDLNFVKYCHTAGCPWTVLDPSHWYILTANMGFLMDDKKKKSVDLVKRMKKCVRYIESTAKLGNRCELKNYVGVRYLSIKL